MSIEKIKFNTEQKSSTQLKRTQERKKISHKGDKENVNCNKINLNPKILTIALNEHTRHLKDRSCQTRYNRKIFSKEK